VAFLLLKELKTVKSKLSHPAAIIAISIILSQCVSWTLNTVVAGVDEVRSDDYGYDTGSLADFEPFSKAVNFFFKPYTKDELGESEPEPFFLENDMMLMSHERRLYELDGMPNGPFQPAKTGRIDELENEVADLHHKLKDVRELQKAVIGALRDIDHKCFRTP
jgi:hypothetical protein